MKKLFFDHLGFTMIVPTASFIRHIDFKTQLGHLQLLGRGWQIPVVEVYSWEHKIIDMNEGLDMFICLV